MKWPYKGLTDEKVKELIRNKINKYDIISLIEEVIKDEEFLKIIKNKRDKRVIKLIHNYRKMKKELGL